MSNNTNNLTITHPELSKQWHPTRNGDLTPADVTTESNRVVWWQCEKGHEWSASVNSRTKGTGCPYCATKKTIAGFNN